jgi:hypothetical protein
MYIILDKFFFTFHTALICFNLFGWIWKKTRVPNLIAILLTLLSWTLLGIWYGFGYCPFTEWHWQVRLKLGFHDMPVSYTKFLVDTFTGMDVNETLINAATVVLLLFALLASVAINIRDWRRKLF